jgi:chemotaxis protein CheD
MKVEAETLVRMGQLAVSKDPEDVLTSLGLGSCIGLALVDAGKSVAGLAHIMLPESRPGVDDPARFADTAVPLLYDEVVQLGARKHALRAVMVGGAHMFALNKGNAGALDIGGRNEAATLDALGSLGLAVSEACTGGSTGRTMRVRVGDAAVTVKEAGSTEYVLWEATA